MSLRLVVSFGLSGQLWGKGVNSWDPRNGSQAAARSNFLETLTSSFAPPLG